LSLLTHDHFVFDQWREALGDQIVDFVASDGDFGEFASGEGGGQNYFAVHVGGIGFGTG
jgi:hypothetical protein